MRWVKALVDRSIAEHFGWPDLEFAWKQDRDIDPLTQAQINQIYLAAGVLSPGEVRAEIGKGDAKRQAGSTALGKDWQTQGRQGEGAKNPAWFGNGTSGGVILVAGERPSGGGQAPQRLSVRPFSSAESQRILAFQVAQQRLAQIAPSNRFATSIERDDWVPEESEVREVQQEYQNAVRTIAARIAGGHAYEDHADAIKECLSPRDFESMIKETIREPSYQRVRADGGMYFYSSKRNLIVIVDPMHPDNGTAFRHSGGAEGAKRFINGQNP